MKKLPVEGILLDFATITNPRILLETIIVHKKTHNNIFVTSDTLKCEYCTYDKKGNKMGRDLIVNLSNKYAYLDFEDLYNSNNKDNKIILNDFNFPLSLKILHFAIQEKIIVVIDNDFIKEGIQFLHDNELEFVHSPMVHYENFSIVSANSSDYSYINDVGTITSNNLHYISSFGGYYESGWLRKKGGVAVQYEESLVGKTFESFQFDSIDEIFTMVKNPSLFNELC